MKRNLERSALRAAMALVTGGLVWACSGTPTERRMPIDVLVVLQNSGTIDLVMPPLADAFPSFVDALPRDDRRPVRIGVVTTDLGGNPMFSTGECTALGDDGVLLEGPRGDSPCADPPAAFVDVGTGVDPAEVASIRCALQVGTGGCTLRRPLEAAVMAVADDRSSVTFPSGRNPHGDDVNTEFLRDGSVLVVLFVTTDDDCSVSDDRYLAPAESPCFDGSFCGDSALHPEQRYASVFQPLRGTNLVTLSLVGLPLDLVPGAVTGAERIEAILGDPRLASGETSCTVPVAARSPRRLLQTVSSLPNPVVASLCRANLEATLAELGEAVAAIATER